MYATDCSKQADCVACAAAYADLFVSDRDGG
jgi:hypothetical protein